MCVRRLYLSFISVVYACRLCLSFMPVVYAYRLCLSVAYVHRSLMSIGGLCPSVAYVHRWLMSIGRLYPPTVYVHLLFISAGRLCASVDALMVTRRVSEGEARSRFALANASGYQGDGTVTVMEAVMEAVIETGIETVMEQKKPPLNKRRLSIFLFRF